jgi:sugar phosphate isomerase/epimerase
MSEFGDRYGINTYSYTQSLSAAACVRHLADKGTRAIELMFFPGHVWLTDEAASLKELRDAITSNGVTLLSMNSPNIDLNIAAATEEMRELTLDINKRYLRIAGELGAQGLVFGPGKANPLFPLPKEAMTGYFFKALDVLLPIANEVGVNLYLENMSFAFLPAADELMAVLARYGSDEIKICYDVANAHFIGEEPVAGLECVRSRLALVHYSDTTRKVYKHDPIGEGDVDFSALPAALSSVGYTKPVVLEIISHAGDAAIASSIAALDPSGA